MTKEQFGTNTTILVSDKLAKGWSPVDFALHFTENNERGEDIIWAENPSTAEEIAQGTPVEDVEGQAAVIKTVKPYRQRYTVLWGVACSKVLEKNPKYLKTIVQYVDGRIRIDKASKLMNSKYGLKRPSQEVFS